MSFCLPLPLRQLDVDHAKMAAVLRGLGVFMQLQFLTHQYIPRNDAALLSNLRNNAADRD
ncbi:hypothetical protein DD237_004059 [Peronospora effusa]|uniref:Uncharacterized protein n=1 Tax=Peronospora effusa TaxID=542832 RepID=A0A3R7WRA9_9STRA|nr:hypothetical protein DD237_004059 [Peronospora effusa]